MRLSLLLAIALLAALAVAQPSSLVEGAIAAGQVGERYDGYMGFAAAPSEPLRRQVQAINIRRRALYSDLASRRGVTTQVAALATGCELLARISVGEVYMLQDGTWHRRQAGQPAPRPDYCG